MIAPAVRRTLGCGDGRSAERPRGARDRCRKRHGRRVRTSTRGRPRRRDPRRQPARVARLDLAGRRARGSRGRRLRRQRHRALRCRRGRPERVRPIRTTRRRRERRRNPRADTSHRHLARRVGSRRRGQPHRRVPRDASRDRADAQARVGSHRPLLLDCRQDREHAGRGALHRLQATASSVSCGRPQRSLRRSASP